jgi:tripartite-type tricarboxylate transporter receptor subunit TctC
LILALPLATSSAQAQEGKTITMVIGSGAGGGIDLYGRVVTRHIGKHIPGHPTVVAQNMPGAGSIAAANYLYNAAPKDGTAIGILSQGLILDEILRTTGLRFEVAKFNWIGRVSSDVLVAFTWHSAKVKTIADALITEASLGGTGAGSSVTKSPKLLNQVVGPGSRLSSVTRTPAPPCWRWSGVRSMARQPVGAVSPAPSRNGLRNGRST